MIKLPRKFNKKHFKVVPEKSFHRYPKISYFYHPSFKFLAIFDREISIGYFRSDFLCFASKLYSFLDRHFLPLYARARLNIGAKKHVSFLDLDRAVSRDLTEILAVAGYYYAHENQKRICSLDCSQPRDVDRDFPLFKTQLNN